MTEIQTKSQLAQLLAEEGINVIHDPKMSTAAFDPIRRELYLPVLKEMTGDVYDLFVLHEVGHALYTPKDGFHSTPEEKGRRYKGFLNVVEDARIEKKIKRKYPGGRSNMIRGYHNLMEQDFFGVKNINPSSLGMIDRFNLHFKCGLALNIKFSEQEMEFIERGQKLESWDDVLDLVEDLWDYAQNEEISTDLQEFLNLNPNSEDEDEDYGDEMDIELPRDSGQFNDGTESDEDFDSDEQGEGESEGRDDFSDWYDGLEGGSFVNEDHDWNPTQKSLTDESFRESEKNLVDDGIDYAYHYCNVPDYDPTLFIADTNTITNELMPDIEKQVEFRRSNTHRYYWLRDQQTGPENLEEWMAINKPIVSYMVKEFEMRKSANMAKRAKISQTGILNTSALYKYKIDDKIFKSVLHVPEGKNHGLIFYIDFSGSMTQIIGDVVQQVLLMAMFCRQVKIPYRIYGFTNGHCSKLAKILQSDESAELNYKNQYSMKRAKKESILNGKDKDLDFDTSLTLYELFSDRQTSAQHKRIASAMIEFPKLGLQLIPLSGTPLNDAIMNGMNLANDFRRTYNLDIVNTIFMSDGDSHGTNSYRDSTHERGINHFALNRDVINITHKPTNTTVTMERGSRRRYAGWLMTEHLMELYKKSTGSNVIFMNIVNRVEIYNSEKANINWHELKELIRKDGWYKTESDGVDGFYTILSRAFRIKDDAERKFEGTETGSKVSTIKSAFRNMNKNRLKQRFLVGNFIEEIA